MPHPFIKSTLLKNIFSLTFLQGINYLLPLITVPYLVRALGPDGFGILGFSFAVNQYFVLLTDYGFNLSATKIISIRKKDPETISNIFSSVLIIKGIFLIISFCSLLLIIRVSTPTGIYSKVFYLTFLMVVGNALFPIWLFQGLQEMGHIVWVSIVCKALSTGAIFIFVKNPHHIDIAAGLQASGFLLAGLLGFILALRRFHVRVKNPGKRLLWQQVCEGWPIFVSTASISLYTNSNIVLLGVLSNEAQVGYYAAADKIIKAVQGLMAPFSQAIYPHINRLAAQSKEKAIVFLKKTLKLFGSASAVMALSIFFLSEPITSFTLGRDFVPSIKLIEWMSPLPFLIALSNVFGIQTMLPFGLNKEFSRSIVYSSILNLILVIPLTIWLQAEGTAISLFITELFVTICMWHQLSKNKIHLLGAVQNGF